MTFCLYIPSHIQFFIFIEIKNIDPAYTEFKLVCYTGMLVVVQKKALSFFSAPVFLC